MIDPFGNDDPDSAYVLSRVSPGLRQDLRMKWRESELIAIAVLICILLLVSVDRVDNL